MKTKFCLSLLTLTSVVVTTQPANAQTYQPTNRTPVADTTLGTQVSGNGNNFNITGGLNKGQTLFHSFTDFSVPTNGQANFTNPVGNRDIITRVTGSVFSDINGLVNTNGANLFLINPNGIVFGTGAQLNVGKAFVGSTANSLDLVDAGGRTITFGTNANGDAPLLSVAPNVLFDVSRLNMSGGTGQISNFGTLQTTNPSQYIGLMGGNVKVDGGQINAPGGRIDLGGLSAPGNVGLVADGNNIMAQLPTNVPWGDVALTNQAKVNIAGNGGGEIAISARNLEILGASAIGSGITTGLGTPDSVAGDIKLNVTGATVISGAGSGIANIVGTNSSGRGGNITVDTNSLLLQDRAAFQVLTLGRGNAGNVTVTAKNAVVLANARIDTAVRPEGVGTAGNIKIDAASLSLFNVSVLSSSTLGQGNAGNIDVKVTGAMNVRGGGIFGNVTEEGVGAAGNIKIDAASLSLQDAGSFSSTNFGQGNAGNIDVKVTGAVNLGTNSLMSSSVQTGVIGNAGNISINAGSLSLQDNAFLFSSTLGQGNAGEVSVTAKESVSLTERSNISSRVNAGSVGKGGSITIDSATLSLKNGSQISASTLGTSATKPAGRGDAGNIKVKVAGAIDISGEKDGIVSGIRSSIGTGATGNGGNIEIEGGSLSLGDDGRVVATTLGQGNAGNIDVKVSGAVDLQDLATFGSVVGTQAIGNGGNITVDAGSLSLNSSSLSVTTGGRGNAGNVTITAKGNVSLDNNSGISSGVLPEAEGNGGNITVDAGSFSLRNASLLAITTGRGNAGTIAVNATDSINISGEIDKPAGVSVDSINGTGVAGDIIVTAPKITLNNVAIIQSASVSGNGGNISISDKRQAGAVFSPNSKIDLSNFAATDLLILRRGAKISTSARGTAQQGGNGGNININAKLIVAIPNENSDITADAVKGRGGNVEIASQGLFGIKYRPVGSKFTSDITSSSQFGQSGTVNVDTPGTDPGRDTTELPNTTTDASNQISQVCSASTSQNKLTVTGRGGLPPNANDPLTSDVVWQDARAASSQPAISSATNNPAKLPPPAVGWVFDGKGKVTLVAAVTQGQPTGTRVACPQGVGK